MKVLLAQMAQSLPVLTPVMGAPADHTCSSLNMMLFIITPRVRR
jgi:hypothetical protein